MTVSHFVISQGYISLFLFIIHLFLCLISIEHLFFIFFAIYVQFETKKTSHLHRTFLYLYRFYFKINLFYHKNVYNVQHLQQEIFLMCDLKYVFVAFSFCNYLNANVKNNCYDTTISYNSEI